MRRRRIRVSRVRSNPRRRRNPAPARKRRSTRRRPTVRRRRTRRVAVAVANPRRRRIGRRRARRNPGGLMANPWVGVALATAVMGAADGLIRANLEGALGEWLPLGLKVGGAWFFGRKASTKPIAYALGALAVVELVAMVANRMLPAGSPPIGTHGFIALPPGLAGPTGFPTGVGYPWPGVTPRIETNPNAIAYGYMLADAQGYSSAPVM